MHDNCDPAGVANQLEISFGGEVVGHGHLMEDCKRFKVFRGSKVRVAETKTIPSSVKRRRAELLELGRLVLDGKFYRLTEDEEFSSISNAAGVLLGRSANGKLEWYPVSPGDNNSNGPGREVANVAHSTISGRVSGSVKNPTGRPGAFKDSHSDSATVQFSEFTESVEIRQGGDVVAHGRVKPTVSGRGAWNGTDHSGPIIVLAGGTFRAHETESLSGPYRQLREILFDDPNLFDDSGGDKIRRVLKENHEFSSLSAAASAILGAQVNGRNAWTRSDGPTPVEYGADAATSDSEEPLDGLALHVGVLDGDRIVNGIRNGSNVNGHIWEDGPFPVPYVGNSRVVNRNRFDGGTVDRWSAFPADASMLLGLEKGRNEGAEGKRNSEGMSCTRFHLDLRDNPRQFEDAPTGELVTIIGVEALLDINSNQRQDKGAGSLVQKQPLVIVFHLSSDDDVIEGRLAQQLGLWLYGEESLDFKRYLADFIESVTGAAEVEEVIADDMLSFATLIVSSSNASAANRIGNQELLNLASLRTPASQQAADRPATASVDLDLGSDRFAEWNGMGRAVFKRSAMVVVDDTRALDLDISATRAMEASSIYSDVVALAMLEHLTLNRFLKQSQEISNKLLDKAFINDDNNLEHAELLEDLQRDYMANSASYGKLHITMRSNGGDIYRALRVRWRLTLLRNDISEEITRLSEHVGTLASRSREMLEKANSERQRIREMNDAEEMRKREKKDADQLRRREKAIEQQQRIRENTISTAFAFVAIIIGAPALSEFFFNLWGLHPMITFFGTCLLAGGVFALPLLVRRSRDRRNNEGETPEGK